MKEIILPSGNYIFVEVSYDAYDFEIYRIDQINIMLSWNFKDRMSIPIEIGNQLGRNYTAKDFKIISTTKDITEEQCKNLIDKPEYGWYLTYTESNNDSYHCQTAKESLQSLIQANKLDVKQNYLILKKML